MILAETRKKCCGIEHGKSRATGLQFFRTPDPELHEARGSTVGMNSLRANFSDVIATE